MGNNRLQELLLKGLNVYKMINKIIIKDLIERVNSGSIKSDIELQREIIYDKEKQKLVIDSILNNIPLPAFYLWKNDNKTYEVLDGKQRIYSITEFVHNNLLYENKNWKDFDSFLQDKFNNTELTIIECFGDEKLKRKIFNRINTLGVPLSQYEVLNGLHNGEYLRGLTYFVNNDKVIKKFLGTNSRGKNQIFVLNQILDTSKIEKISKYLEKEFQKSFENDKKNVKPHFLFVSEIFDNTKKDKEILLQLAKKYKDEKSIWKSKKDKINLWKNEWTQTDDYKLTNQNEKLDTYDTFISSIINNEKVDNRRNFDSLQKEKVLEKSKIINTNKYICAGCKQSYELCNIEFDHKKPWSMGGKTEIENCQILCRSCNRQKSNK